MGMRLSAVEDESKGSACPARVGQGKGTVAFAQRLVFRGQANKGKCQVVWPQVPSRIKECAKSYKGVGSRDQRGKLEVPESEVD